MLGSGAVAALSYLVENFLDSKDQYSLSEIKNFETELLTYEKNLEQTQLNINVTNQAIAQSLKVEQVSTVSSKTRLGYTNDGK